MKARADLRRTVIIGKSNFDKGWFSEDADTPLRDDDLLVVSDDNHKAERCYNCKYCERGNTFQGKPMPLCKQGDSNMIKGHISATGLDGWCPLYRRELSWVMDALKDEKKD